MNKYISVAQADTRYANRLPTYIRVVEDNEFVPFDVWADSETAEKEQALKDATRWIDSFEYDGHKLSEEQDNEFPRKGQTQVPEQVNIATLDLAIHLLQRYHSLKNEPAHVAFMRQSNINVYTMDVMESRERGEIQEEKTVYAVIRPYLKLWMKGRYSLTRWRN